jgi:hypothetical protein
MFCALRSGSDDFKKEEGPMLKHLMNLQITKEVLTD